MASGRSTSVRTRFGALFMLIGLLTGTFGFLAPRAEAIPVPGDPTGTLTGFEIDGDQASTVPGKLDWQDLVTVVGGALVYADTLTVVTDDTLDSGLQGSSKENDPSGWVCNTGGASPPKNNILHAAVNTRVGPGGAFLDLAYMRQGQTGNAHVNFEFNQQAAGGFAADLVGACPKSRTTGDLLLLFNFPGGDGQADISAFRWNAAISADGEWVPTGVPAASAAAVSNAADVPNFIFPGVATMGNRQFGEASLNLTAILGSDPDDCVSFGELNVRSRSASGNTQDETSNSINSALQDRLVPTPIDLSTCARITIKKVDNSVPPVPTAGAVYGLYDSLAKAQAVAGQTDAQAIAAAVATCTTGADGTCTFDAVNPSTDYWITEISPPPGLLPSTEIRFVDGDDVAALSTIDLTGTPFVNDVPVGNVTITKRLFEDDNGNGVLDPGEQVTPDDAADLDGITFTLQQGGTTAKTHPAGTDATCTITGGAGQCTISSVRLGTYDVVETLNPSGPSGIGLGASPQVTVTTHGQTVTVSYDNPLAPINLSLDKRGTDWADVGEVITYTFDVSTTGPPLTITDIYEVIDLANGFDDRCTTSPMTGPDRSTAVDPDNDADALLEVGETWRWTCQYTVTMADATDADGIELWNKATVEGKDDLGRTVSADDTHLVRIKLPDVSVAKTPDAGVINPGQDATFTIKVLNKADDGIDPPEGIARDVTLTDTLPAGIDWSTTHPDCSITAGVLACELGDLAPGAEVTVTVTGSTTVANCGRLPNTATAAATNELQSDLANNSDDGLITVSCADVMVEKVAHEDPINASDTASFGITVSNLSATAAATGVTLSDSLPSGVPWSVSGADADDCAIDAGVLTCDFGTIEASGTRTVTLSGPTTPEDCGTIRNTAVVSSTNEAPGTGGNNTSTDTIDVACPDVWVAKAAGSATVNANDTITWTITFGNHGPGDAYDVTLTDVLPAGLTGYVLGGPDAALCQLVSGTITCALDVLAAGAEHEITVTGTTDAADCGLVTNPVSIAAGNEHPDDDANNEASSSVTVQCPDIGISKVAAAAVVSAGDDIGFTITVTNDGPGVAYGVTLSDPLPGGDGIDWSIDGASGDVDPGCSIATVAGTQVLTCGPVDLAAGQSFSVHVTSSTDPSGADCIGGELDNTAIADAANDAPVEASDSIEVQCPTLRIDKDADDASVSAGEAIGFTVTVTNDGPGVAYGVTLSDPLPGGDGIDWSVDGASGDVDPGCSIATVAGTQVLTCGPVDLAAGESFSVHVTSDTDPSGEECVGGELDNTATADADNDGPVQDSADITILCPGLNVVKTADDTTVTAGDEIGFSITVSNEAGDGVGTAYGVTLDDPLPAGDGINWKFSGESGDVVAGCGVTGAVGTQVLSCGPVDLAPGQSFTVHVTSDTDPSGAECSAAVLDNIATADADNTGPETDGADITIQCPDLSITKVADDDVVDAGQDIGFTIVVSNAGPGAAHDVVISDPLPTAPGVAWSVDPAVEGCLIVLNLLTCSIGDLPAGGSFEVHVTGTTPGGLDNEDLPAACTVYDNTATASLSNDASEEASASTEVVCPLDVTIDKDGPDLAHRGDEITYTFEVTNTGKVDLLEVVLTDPMCDEGTLTLVDDGDGDTILAIGEVWAYECTRVVTEDDPDPLPNTAIVVGTDARERATEDEDDHLVDLIAPDIDVDKTVDDATPDVGQTVTFTYVVTNTGDTTLFDVAVVDDQLGPVGTIAQLEPGESSILTMTMVVAPDSPVRNVALATGEDVLGLEVSDEDDAVITIVLPAIVRPVPAPVPQAAPQQLPRTGTGADLLLVVGGSLLVAGGAMVATGAGLRPSPARRRRS